MSELVKKKIEPKNKSAHKTDISKPARMKIGWASEVYFF